MLVNVKVLIGLIILGKCLCHNVVFANNTTIDSNDQLMINQMSLKVFKTTISKAEIKPLQGGFSGDKLFLISHKNQKIVLRIHQKNKDIQEKKQEYEISKIASDLEIGPKVLYVSEKYDLLATKYLNSQHPDFKTFKTDKNINHLAEALIKLHNGPKISNNWSVFDYIKKITPKALTEKEKLAIIELDKIKRLIQSKKFPKKLCHNDIQPNNFFLSENKTLFIDWGDAGMSDPFWDLARISMEFAFDAKQDLHLLKKYLSSITNLDKNRFFLMKQVFLIRSAFWSKNITGAPDKENLKKIIKIFEANNHPLETNKKITWNYLHTQAIELFLKNTQTDLYKKSLNNLT
jgi:thiamine kinase-like enzyme